MIVFQFVYCKQDDTFVDGRGSLSTSILGPWFVCRALYKEARVFSAKKTVIYLVSICQIYKW